MADLAKGSWVTRTLRYWWRMRRRGTDGSQPTPNWSERGLIPRFRSAVEAPAELDPEFATSIYCRRQPTNR